MNYRAFLNIFLFVIVCKGCNSQTKTNISKVGKDTVRIYLSGAIRDIQSKEPIPFAMYAIFSTDTGGVWKNPVRGGLTDKSGNFGVDITTLVDSTKTLVIRSKNINYGLTHVIIKGKIKKSISVDVEVITGSGDYYTYYKVNPKKSNLKLEKQINKITSFGY